MGNVSYILPDSQAKKLELTNYRETSVVATIVAGTLALDLASGNHFRVALNADITNITFSNVPAAGKACTVTLKFTYDGTLRSITWPASVTFDNDVPPTMGSTNGKRGLVTLYTDDSAAEWLAFVGGLNF